MVKKKKENMEQVVKETGLYEYERLSHVLEANRPCCSVCKYSFSRRKIVDMYHCSKLDNSKKSAIAKEIELDYYQKNLHSERVYPHQGLTTCGYRCDVVSLDDYCDLFEYRLEEVQRAYTYVRNKQKRKIQERERKIAVQNGVSQMKLDL